MKNILKPKEMSELLGVSDRTLQRWDKESKLTGCRIYGLRKQKQKYERVNSYEACIQIRN